MPLPTETINIDIDIPNGSEFTSAALHFTLSGPDSDSGTGIVLAPHEVVVNLDGNGQGTASLWPVDGGINGRFYTVTLFGFVANSTDIRQYVLGKIQPLDGGGPYSLAELLQAGGAVAGPAFYSVITEAQYAAIIAAAAQATASADAIAASGFFQRETEAPGSVQDRIGDALGQNEVRTAINAAGRRVAVPGDNVTYVVNTQDHAPAYHWIYPATGETNIDLAGLGFGDKYVFHHLGNFGSKVTFDVPSPSYFKGAWFSPSTVDVRSFTIVAGESARITRIGGTIYQAEKINSGLKVSSAGGWYRRGPDGLYEVLTVIPAGTPTIASGSQVQYSVNANLDLSGAFVESICLQPENSTTAGLPPNITRMGTTHGLLTYRFILHNPHATDITARILVKFSNVVGP